jgi:hypothetical protein
VGEVILSGKRTEKGGGEDVGKGLIGVTLGAWIAYLTENVDKMGKIVEYGIPP